jgi:hypothetical protein
MQQRKRIFIRPLLLVLMLVLGPLHAQTIFACTMMDVAMHDDCCCDDDCQDKDCVDSTLDTALDSSEEPCCEQSVEVRIDEDARQHAPIVKHAEVGSDVDQLQTIFTSFYVIEPPRTAGLAGLDQSFPTPSRSDSDTYLITQRLRI